MVSVRLGAKDIMRRTDCGTRTLRPTSSTTSRKAGASVEGVVALCAREGAAAHKKKARAAQTAEWKCGRSNFSICPFESARIFIETKKPHETPGGLRLRPFSRRARPSAAREGGLADGCASRSQWRDRGRFTRPSPLPCLQIEKSV